MASIRIRPSESMDGDFIPEEYLPKGKDQYWLRNQQNRQPENKWRQLTEEEIAQLEQNDNRSSDWAKILVGKNFTPSLIKNNRFYGLVRIGAVEDLVLEHHELRLPAGITNSLIVSSDIGDNACVHNVHYLAHYIIGDYCILFNIDEMHTTNHAKFGNGIVKEGEDEKVRIELDLMNETGSRSILPFDGIIPADAYIWAKYRDDEKLQMRLKEITQERFDAKRGYYGTVDKLSVIKNCRILKDVKIGEAAYIKGANKLKNLTINSSEDEPSQIGEGVELVNGIVGYGCHVFYGVKAVRFVLGDNSSLKYGARLIHSFLGENSTVSCCEVLNNLIFPAHEQHHNNSFLIASLVKGQSNLAAGATIGSNHNSRANDNEISAGRGFWPGLCTSIKHSSTFASFTLLSKGSYPAEMNIPLPFSLLNNNVHKNRLEIIPAFWWLYNMYAMARNSWKFSDRDRRRRKVQNVEFDALAPDTAEEIIHALELLEVWTGESDALKNGKKRPAAEEARKKGREILAAGTDAADPGITADALEKSSRQAVILKAAKAWNAYREMLHHYAFSNILEYSGSVPKAGFAEINKKLSGPRQKDWINIGGQLVQEKDLDKLRKDIGSGKLKDWPSIHVRYDELWDEYPLQKQKHAWALFCMLYETEKPDIKQWKEAAEKAAAIQDYICAQVRKTRKKDFENPFRRQTYRNEAEMTAAIGTIDDNEFVKEIEKQTGEYKTAIAELVKRN